MNYRNMEADLTPSFKELIKKMFKDKICSRYFLQKFLMLLWILIL
uniref:Uncharacterized protein n=1 Tax=Myoviridae sp. ctCo31 TaxID=2825053 RepID=A0A8S5UM03_9CAUD|nr:MAG TPA: hypothetical protein [Myoviridae sp. ctCo31]